MAKGTPEEIAQRWSSRLAGATDVIQRGVQAVTVSPGQAAARQKDAYVQGVQASSAKWASRVASVSTSDWQQAVISKGLPRVASGATAAQPKMAAFMSRVLPHIESARAGLPPRGNLEANIQRSAAFARKMAEFRNGR